MPPLAVAGFLATTFTMEVSIPGTRLSQSSWFPGLKAIPRNVLGLIIHGRGCEQKERQKGGCPHEPFRSKHLNGEPILPQEMSLHLPRGGGGWDSWGAQRVCRCAPGQTAKRLKMNPAPLVVSAVFPPLNLIVFFAMPWASGLK